MSMTRLFSQPELLCGPCTQGLCFNAVLYAPVVAQLSNLRYGVTWCQGHCSELRHIELEPVDASSDVQDPQTHLSQALHSSPIQRVHSAASAACPLSLPTLTEQGNHGGAIEATQVQNS